MLGLEPPFREVSSQKFRSLGRCSDKHEHEREITIETVAEITRRAIDKMGHEPRQNIVILKRFLPLSLWRPLFVPCVIQVYCKSHSETN